MRKTIGLVIPTRWEARTAFSRFKFKSAKQKIYEAEFGGHKILACISGVGAKAATRASERLVAAGAQELVSYGFCGALVPELHTGDLVTDRIITSDVAACTPDARRALRERANAVAVDMETRAIVETGTLLGVPIRVLRVVSDEFFDDLSPLFGKSGKFSSLGIAMRLLNPKTWPLAAKLRLQSHVANDALADALEDHLS